MKCIIVDDDELSRMSLQFLASKIDGLEVVEVCESALEALKVLKGNEVDLLLLDIEMPALTGMELVKSFDKLPNIIFITSKSEYAVEAFEFKELVIDYITKPVDLPRFIKAINRAKERVDKHDKVVDESTEIFIKNNSSLVRVKYDDILWIEALENYVVVNTFKDKYTIHFTMKAISEKMPSEKFVRIHRSFIVNIGKIKLIEDNSVVVKYDGGSKVIPIGKSYKEKLMNDINLITK